MEKNSMPKNHWLFGMALFVKDATCPYSIAHDKARQVTDGLVLLQ